MLNARAGTNPANTRDWTNVGSMLAQDWPTIGSCLSRVCWEPGSSDFTDIFYLTTTFQLPTLQLFVPESQSNVLHFGRGFQEMSVGRRQASCNK